jgi:hypothetical protein
MKTIICLAAGLLAAVSFGSGAQGFSANGEWVKPAVQQAGKTAFKTVKHRRGHGSGAFRHWCAYNCYAASRHGSGHALGRYGYSAYAYDEDTPFRYRFDRDASLVDNIDAVIYAHTGEPVMRVFERVY